MTNKEKILFTVQDVLKNQFAGKPNTGSVLAQVALLAQKSLYELLGSDLASRIKVDLEAGGQPALNLSFPTDIEMYSLSLPGFPNLRDQLRYILGDWENAACVMSRMKDRDRVKILGDKFLLEETVAAVFQLNPGETVVVCSQFDNILEYLRLDLGNYFKSDVTSSKRDRIVLSNKTVIRFIPNNRIRTTLCGISVDYLIAHDPQLDYLYQAPKPFYEQGQFPDVGLDAQELKQMGLMSAEALFPESFTNPELKELANLIDATRLATFELDIIQDRIA